MAAWTWRMSFAKTPAWVPREARRTGLSSSAARNPEPHRATLTVPDRICEELGNGAQQLAALATGERIATPRSDPLRRRDEKAACPTTEGLSPAGPIATPRGRTPARCVERLPADRSIKETLGHERYSVDSIVLFPLCLVRINQPIIFSAIVYFFSASKVRRAFADERIQTYYIA